ncbi:MAG: hypothetical protein ACP5JG_19135 [Anaerolineae bacterium]
MSRGHRRAQIKQIEACLRPTEILDDDEILTVDGYLGIVTVGPPEFSLESLETEG